MPPALAGGAAKKTGFSRRKSRLKPILFSITPLSGGNLKRRFGNSSSMVRAVAPDHKACENRKEYVLTQLINGSGHNAEVKRGGLSRHVVDREIAADRVSAGAESEGVSTTPRVDSCVNVVGPIGGLKIFLGP